MEAIKLTKATFYILPMLFFPNSYFKGFVNCYIRDENHSVLKRNIFVVLNTKKIKDVDETMLKLRSHSFFIMHYKLGEYVVLIYDVPSFFMDDYRKFLLGQYSQFSSKYKKVILDFYPKYIDERLSKNAAVMYPDDEESQGYRNGLENSLGVKIESGAEILSIPTISEETFKISKIVKMFEEPEYKPYLVGSKEEVRSKRSSCS